MIVSVLVKPGSSQEKVVEGSEGNLVVFTHARAHDGEANKKVIQILAEHYGVSKSQVKLVRGAKGRAKVFEI